jgi:serine/threonine-protein kinase
MSKGNSADPVDVTLPPLNAKTSVVCPRCHRGTADASASSSGNLLRCAEHDLALVTPAAVIEAQGDALLGTTLAGRFTILSRLGAGSMGSVYRARQEAVGRDVALKVVRRDRAYDPETKARFEREARATSALASPHTVTVFDFGEAENGCWFLAMEMLEGETLGDRLRRVKRLPLHEALTVARQVLTSLAEAHGKGIVHRDLKPDNVFLAAPPYGSGDVCCKVLDFGIAKLTTEELRLDQLETQAGTVFGTPRYMSPEQAQGKPLDLRSDLYSVGVLLYQMLAGRAPFIDDDAVVVMARHIKDEPPTFASVASDVSIPVAVEIVVRRALAKDPAARPSSADAFLSELDGAMQLPAAESQTSWGIPARGAAASEQPRRKLGGATAFAAVLTVVIAGSLAASSGRPSTLRAAGSAPLERAAAAMTAAELRPTTSSSTRHSGVPAPTLIVLPVHEPPTPRVSTPPARSAAARPPRQKPPTRATAQQVRRAGERYGRFE